MMICSLQDIRPPALAPPPPIFPSRSGVNDVANRSAAVHSVFDFIRPRLHCYNFARALLQYPKLFKPGLNSMVEEGF